MKSTFVELTDVGKSHINTEELDTSNLLPNEALIKAEYSMISAGTELSRAFAIKKGFKYPVRPGYCMVGTILDKGSDLNDFNIGDKVFTGSNHASITRFINSGKIQAGYMFKLPEGIDLKQATIINLCLVAMQGVNLTDVKINDTVGIFGLGNIGILVGLMYQKMGCNVIGLDPVENRCDFAKQMGIKFVSSNLNQQQVVSDYTNGKGADICVDVTGISPAIISAINSAKRYGQVLLLGTPRQSYECDVALPFNRIHMQGLKVIGGFNASCPVESVEGSDDSAHKNFDIICQMIMNKDIDVDKLITRVIDPKDCEQAYYDLMYNKDKVNCIVYDWTNY